MVSSQRTTSGVPCSLGECGRCDPAEGQARALGGGRVREEVEHGAAPPAAQAAGGGVALAHLVEGERLVVACVPRLAESRMRSAITSCIAARAGFR